MSALLAELTARRPELDPETPFAEVLDALSDAVLAVTKVADLVALNPEDFREEFGLRTEDEQTQFGVAVTLGVLALSAGVDQIGNGVANAFEEHEPAAAEAE